MKKTLLLTFIAACASAQEPMRIRVDQVDSPKIIAEKMTALGAGPVGVGMTLGENVKGAPYSATIVTESIQTLADGNRISQKNQGGVARDSQGRMRHEAILPVIGNMNAAAGAPKFIFINDPIAGVTYTLNPAEKVVRKSANVTPDMMEMKKAAERKMAGDSAGAPGVAVARSAERTFTFERSSDVTRVVAPPPGAAFETGVVTTKLSAEKVQLDHMKSESLGSKVIDGVVADGMRTTRTIPAGEIGNEKAIEVVSETWYSPELKTVVYSKRSDPRSGDQIYSLTNISRAEPDASLFQVPADYRVSESAGPGNVIMYRTKE